MPRVVGAILIVRGTVPTTGDFMHRHAVVRIRLRSIITVAVVMLLSLTFAAADLVVQATPAHAGVSAVVNRGPAGVTADALPTVQINGVVWTQVVVGNTVFVGGQFSTARPAGAAPGKLTVRRSNILAFDIRTGRLVSGFAPSTNGAVRALAASADRKWLYVGGEFTVVNGVKRLRFARVAINSGSLSPMSLSFNKPVRAFALSGSTLYVGGSFDRVGRAARNRLAAVNVTSGKLRSWRPAANGRVYAITLTPDRRQLVVGGSFAKIGSARACGMARLGLKRGELLSWPINTVVRNCGEGTAVLSLKSDSTRVYGSGFTYRGDGNYEGVFAATGTGRVSWLQDCRGDTYDVAVANGRVYSVGHPHNCGNIGAFPDTSPKTYHAAVAVTASATGTVGRSPGGYTAFQGKPSPSMVNWFPRLDPGTIAGQAAWSVVAAGPYVVLAGEFVAVNGVPQQGIVRMATAAYAPRQQGPLGVTSTASNPSGLVNTDNSVTVSWKTASDRDDQLLTYALMRDGVVIDRRTVNSRFWDRRALSFRDVGLTPGTRYRWKITVSDPDGNAATTATVGLTIPVPASPAPSADPSSPAPGVSEASATQTPTAPSAGG